MTIDITTCIKINIADSCAVSNLLSSLLLFSRLDNNNFHFSMTKYVEYECLHKERTSISTNDTEFRKRLIRHQKNSKFTSHNITIEDLQDELILKYSKQLGIGELSSIAFSKKINQPFLTDDQKARKIARAILGDGKVQTTPQIVGWLFYEGLFSDVDLDTLIAEHNTFQRPLEKFFREVYHEAYRIKSMHRKADK
jgi:predicted nucleic acid-binding protein